MLEIQGGRLIRQLLSSNERDVHHWYVPLTIIQQQIENR